MSGGSAIGERAVVRSADTFGKTQRCSGEAEQDTPFVSVVCPCLNSASTLAVQLDALAAQECDFAWEMIVVDDGSTDDTVNVARSFAQRLPALRVIQSDRPRSSTALALNAGVAAARGRYLVLVDSDDEVAPGYLQAMKNGLDVHPAVGGRIDEVTLNPAWTQVRFEPMQVGGLTVLNGFLPLIVGASFGVRRDVFTAVGGFDPTAGTSLDADLSWRLQLAGFEAGFVPDAVLRYRYRTTLRSHFRQKRKYALGDVYLARKFAAQGAPTRATADPSGPPAHPLRVACRGWREVLRALVRIRDRRSLMLFLDLLGGAVGRIQGSITYRYLYL